MGPDLFPCFPIHSEAFKPYLPQLVQVFLDLVMRKTTSVDFYPDLTSSDPLNFFVSFLINLASNDATFGTQLFWYLRVSSRSVKDKSDNSFAKLQGIFLGALAQTKEGSEMAANLYSQVELFAKFENLMKIIKRQKVSREQKQEMIVNFLDDPNNGLMSFKHISLPINPNIIVSGILADRCTLFKSNALPVKFILLPVIKKLRMTFTYFRYSHVLIYFLYLIGHIQGRR